MILRRVIEHVKDQNWTAVALDFVIVVVGVFIGIQVSNWNDVRNEQLSEVQYLERFAEEIELTIAHIQKERTFSESSIRSIENFTERLYLAEVSNKELIEATSAYFSNGAFFARLSPNRTTFDDLITTGNFDVIRDEEIRTGLIKLHALYDESKIILEGNIDWLQQGEPLIYYQFDAFRFDARTGALFEDVSIEDLSADVLRNRDLLRRHASSHYWIKIRSVELYDLIEPQAKSVLELINAELEAR